MDRAVGRVPRSLTPRAGERMEAAGGSRREQGKAGGVSGFGLEQEPHQHAFLAQRVDSSARRFLGGIGDKAAACAAEWRSRQHTGSRAR